MADEKRPTAAELYVRSLFPDPGSSIADLGVLALERALIREKHEFSILVHGDPSSPFLLDTVPFYSPNRPASQEVWPNDVIHPESMDVAVRCRHVADWIVQATMNGSPWLERTDDLGRPLKLLKLGSLGRAAKEADKEMKIYLSRFAAGGPVGRGETLHADLGDGWNLVRLLTPEALDLESARMRHCIGQGAYDEAVASEQKLFLSLRDPNGNAHATLEIVADGRTAPRLEQFQGKQNRRPLERYVRRVRPWLRSTVAVERPGSSAGRDWWTGLVRGADGGILDLDDLPDEVAFMDDVALQILEGDVLPSISMRSEFDIHLLVDPDRRSPIALPASLSTTAELKMSGRGSFVSGPHLHAHGLTAVDCGIEFPRQRADAEGGSPEPSPSFSCETMVLTRTKVRSLPAGARIGSLIVVDCRMPEVPPSTRIDVLDATGMDIERIGPIEGLDVLRLDGVSEDLDLPERLVLGSELHILGPSFPRRLPETIEAGFRILIENAPGLVLPSGTKTAFLKLHRSTCRIGAGSIIEKVLHVGDGSEAEIEEGCSIGRINVDHEAGTYHRAEDPITIEFDPRISLVDSHGSMEMRDETPRP